MQIVVRKETISHLHFRNHLWIDRGLKTKMQTTRKKPAATTWAAEILLREGESREFLGSWINSSAVHEAKKRRAGFRPLSVHKSPPFRTRRCKIIAISGLGTTQQNRLPRDPHGSLSCASALSPLTLILNIPGCTV